MTPSVYRRYRAFYDKWGSLVQLVQGAIVVAISVVLLIIGLTVLAQSSEQAAKRHKEAVTTREACLRAIVFGPPLLDHLERVEERLHLHALEESVEWPLKSKRFEPILTFYRSTIPKSCPGA